MIYFLHTPETSLYSPVAKSNCKIPVQLQLMYHALTYTSLDNIQKGWMYTTETKMVYTCSTICMFSLTYPWGVTICATPKLLIKFSPNFSKADNMDDTVLVNYSKEPCFLLNINYSLGGTALNGLPGFLFSTPV